ncbi:MAG: alkaline phosphatase D family protein [Acidobacteriota bacterium]|jgi:phosphodiesterase/alkaline phosphatase D-like protein|nr:MAG: hypothetical protein DIU54_14470 [Acidobacteriota bacterium]
MNRRQWLRGAAAVAAGLLRPVRIGRFDPVLDAQAPGIVRWMWSGAVTSSSATVVARVLAGSGSVRLRVRPVAGGAGTLVEPRLIPEWHIARFDIVGLRPATTYIYDILLDGVAWATTGRFRTMNDGPHDAVVLFGSCASTGSNARVWETMGAVGADLLIHMGDFHYEDIARNEPALFHQAYDRCLMSPRQSACYRGTPVAYVWDDHDFGGDDSDRHSSSAPAAHAAYRACVPHYPLGAGSEGPLHQAFDLGRVRVIVTDSRSARERPEESSSPSMLGAAQREWLLAQLEDASRRAPLVVWANPVPWITKADESTREGWAPYADERALIAAHIERLGLTGRLLMISGDAHMAAIDDGTNSQYAPGPTGRGFVVAHAAAFDRFRRRKGGPYSLGARAGRGQFGELRIEDSGDRLVATVRCRDRRGRQIDRLAIRLTIEDGATSLSYPAVEEPASQGAA